jgi:hypothetical protein
MSSFATYLKSALTNRPFALPPDVCGFGNVTVMSAFAQARISGLLKQPRYTWEFLHYRNSASDWLFKNKWKISNLAFSCLHSLQEF